MGEQRPQVADKELAALDRLVGTWRLSGGAAGTIRYRWLKVVPSAEKLARR